MSIGLNQVKSKNAEKSPEVGAAGGKSLGGHRLHRPDALQTLQPRLRSRLKAQATRAAGQRCGSAAQNAQALLIEVKDGYGVAGFFHSEIVRGRSDAGVSVKWQLCDRTRP